MNEKHHAYLITQFYRSFHSLSVSGQAADAVFLSAARIYGEQRGHRMALRALRDGHPLDYASYFAYGEWEPGPDAFDMTYDAEKGRVTEQVLRCPWEAAFEDSGDESCGRLYCSEIDRSIVRGFNPQLIIEVPCSLYQDGKCQFHYRSLDIASDIFHQGEECLKKAKGPVIMPFAYHCAHLWKVFCGVSYSVFGAAADPAINKIRFETDRRFGEFFFEEIDHYKKEDFDFLPFDQDKRGYS